MPRHELAHESVEAQREVFRAMLNEMLTDLHGNDVTMAQIKALAAIERQPECNMGMLSEALGVKPPAASLLVDKLVRAGLAYRLRDDADARRVIVHPTVKGVNLISRVRRGGRSLLESWVNALSDDDLAALRKGLTALVAVAQGFHLASGKAQPVSMAR